MIQASPVEKPYHPTAGEPEILIHFMKMNTNSDSGRICYSDMLQKRITQSDFPSSCNGWLIRHFDPRDSIV